MTEEELTEAKNVLNDEEYSKLNEELGNKNGIEGYWLTTFKNCEMIAPEIKPKDEPLL